MCDNTFRDDARRTAPRPPGLMGRVLIAALISLAVTAGSRADDQCRLQFDNRLGHAFELVDLQGNVIGHVAPSRSTSIVLAAPAQYRTAEYRLRFANATAPAGFAREAGAYRLHMRMLSLPFYSTSDLQACRYEEFGDRLWADERSLDVQPRGIFFASASAPTGPVSLTLQDEHGDWSRDSVTMNDSVINITLPAPRRQAGDCIPNDEGRITCQAQLNINRAIGNFFAERAQEHDNHAQRCQASGETFYVAAPDKTGAMGDVVLCRREAELSRDAFAGKAVRANFRNFSLERFNFEGATLAGSVFSGTGLAGANFVRADLSGVDLSGANLQGANLSGANVAGANLTDANLNRAILYNANFTGANMEGTLLGAADLTGASLSRVQNIAHFVISETTVLCNTVGYNDEVMNYNCITPTQFLDADQSHRDYSGRNLAGYDFSNRILQGVNFSGSDLSGASFQGANLTDANLENVNLTGADLSRTNMNGTRFAGADLTRATLLQAEFDVGIFGRFGGTTFCETVGADGEVASVNCPQTVK
jgi:uncharacterized protein YjbI with pentapeptide repeats